MGTGIIYGYIRVSSKEQNEDRQRIAMRNAGVNERNMFIDKQSGKDFNRPGFKKLLKKLKEDDVLIIKSIDRLGRDYQEIKDQWRIITKEKKTDIVVLDNALLDTRKGKDLTGTLIADIVLELMSYFAQTERELIRQRQAEGIAAAKQRGVRFGRPPIEKPKEFELMYDEWKLGRLSIRQAASCLSISRQTFLNWIKKRKQDNNSTLSLT